MSGAGGGLAAIERVVSPGGIEAWLVEETTVPIIVVDLAFRGGAALDPAERPGVANLLSALLDEGAGPYDSEAFQQRLEEHAIELSFHATRDAVEGGLRTLAEKREEAFELLRLAVTEARLDAEPVGRVGAQILARIRHNLAEPGAIAEESWHAAAFPGHAYGRPVLGSESSLGAIGRDDLAGYRARAFTRDRLVVTVVGAIDAKTLAPALDRIFGALPASAPVAAVADVGAAGAGTLSVVPLAVPQTTLLFGRPGLARHDPDYIAATVANHIVGGGTFTARLFTEVREKRGLAYSVHTWLDPMRHAATVMGSLATKNERAGEAIGLVESEIRRFVADGPGKEELDKAKKYLTGSYALNFDSSVKIARGLKQIRLHDLPIDYISERNRLVDAVGPADIRRAAERLFGDGDLFTVAVGEPVGLAASAAAAE